MAKFTEEDIEDLVCAPGQKGRLVFDDALPGLAVRITSSGKKMFLAQYTIAGQRRRVPIGRWGAVTLKAARLAARGILGDVAKGQDVAQVRTATRKAKAADTTAEKLTLTALLKQWDSLALAERRPNYRREAVRALKTAFPDHLTRRADALTRDTALSALDALVKAGKTTMAGRTLAYGRVAYTSTLKRGMVAAIPFQGLPIGTGTVSRDRVLNMDEVALIWSGARAMIYPFGPLFRLLLLTAQRREEVAGMGWSEISADGTIWTIPKHRAKNKRAHIVHLPPESSAILDELPRFAGVDEAGAVVTSDLVFTTNGKTSVSGFTRAKNKLDEKIEEARTKEAVALGRKAPVPLPGWRLHDFRRTAVTWLAANGVAPHVADRLLNHVQGTISGVAAVYQRAEFLAERKEALEAWASQFGNVQPGLTFRQKRERRLFGVESLTCLA